MTDTRCHTASVYECSQLCGFRSTTAPKVEKCNACEKQSESFGEFCSCGAQDFSPVCPDCGADAVCDHPDTQRNRTDEEKAHG